MNGKDLLCAISEVDEDYVNQSNQFSAVKSAVRAQRRKKVSRLTAGGIALVLCFSAVGIFGHTAKFSKAPVTTANADINTKTDDISDAAKQEEDVSATESHDSADGYLPETAKKTVVWGEPVKGNDVCRFYVPMGTAKISEQLYDLMKGRAQDTFYAVMVDFSCSVTDSEQSGWKLDGKTVGELQAEIADLSKSDRTYMVTDAEGNQTVGYLPPPENEAKIAALVKEINNIRKAFLEKKYEGFKDSFVKQGFEVYINSESDVTDNKVFYTFATKTQLESFRCRSSEAFCFLPAARLK